jgi:hypothetical protein
MGLFGRKKPAEPPVEFNQLMVMQMPMEIGRAMIYDYADHHGGENPSTLSATLEIDELGRVSTISQPTGNGIPYVPTVEVVVTLNGILQPFSTAPAKSRATAFSFSYDNGRFDGRFTYPQATES